jgi:signal transduction histidine kinase
MSLDTAGKASGELSFDSAAEGAGIALAVVDAIARGHGGTAHAVNRSGGGADVWMWLPARPPSGDGRPEGEGRAEGASR